MAIRLLTAQDREMARKAIAAGVTTPDETDDWSQQLSDFDQGIDITPWTPQKKLGSVGYIDPQAPQPRVYTDKQLEAANRGLDIDTGAPFMAGFSANFANNENEKIKAYKLALKKDLGYEPTVIASKDFPGEYEYLRKTETGGLRRTLITAPAGNLVGAFAGSPGETILGTVGAVGGALGGGGVFGGIAGGALGSGTGAFFDTPYRDWVGREIFGINQKAEDPTARQAQLDALERNMYANATQSGAVSLGTDAFSLGNRFLKYWFKGLNPLNPVIAKELLNNSEAGFKLVTELNTFATPGKELKISIPGAATTPVPDQKLGHIIPDIKNYVPTPAAREAMALEGQVLGNEELGAGLRQYHQQANESLMDIYDNINRKTVPIPPRPSSFEAGSPILDAARTERNKMQSDMELDAVNQEHEVRDFIARNFPNLPPAQQAAEVRKALAGNLKYWKENEKLAWQTWDNHFKDEQGNFKDILIPIDAEFAQFLRNDTGKKYYTLFRNMDIASATKLNKGAPLNEADRLARARLGVDSAGERIAEDPQTQIVGLYGLTSDIKNLRARLRQAEKASGFTLDNEQRKELEVQLRNFRDRAMEAINRPDLKQDLKIAEDMSAIKAERFAQGIPLKALGKKRQTWTATDISVLAQVLKYQDVDAYNQFSRVMRESPGGPQKMRELFLGAYTAEAVDKNTGLPTPELHNAFMKKYGWAMKEWFPEGKLGLIDDMKHFAAEVVNRRRDLARFDDAFKNQFGRFFKGEHLESLDAKDLVDGVWSGQMPESDMVQLKGFLEQLDARQGTTLMDQWRAGVLQSLRDKITVDGNLNSTNMKKILDERSFPLRALFGDEYVKNFNKVFQALKMTELEGAARVTGKSERKWFEYLARATWAPPLSREGRLLTLGTFLRSESYKKNLAELFTNPAALRYMADFSKMRLDEQIWRNVATRAFNIAAVDKNDRNQ